MDLIAERVVFCCFADPKDPWSKPRLPASWKKIEERLNQVRQDVLAAQADPKKAADQLTEVGEAVIQAWQRMFPMLASLAFRDVDVDEVWGELELQWDPETIYDIHFESATDEEFFSLLSACRGPLGWRFSDPTPSKQQTVYDYLAHIEVNARVVQSLDQGGFVAIAASRQHELFPDDSRLLMDSFTKLIEQRRLSGQLTTNRVASRNIHCKSEQTVFDNGNPRNA